MPLIIWCAKWCWGSFKLFITSTFIVLNWSRVDLHCTLALRYPIRIRKKKKIGSLWAHQKLSPTLNKILENKMHWISNINVCSDINVCNINGCYELEYFSLSQEELFSILWSTSILQTSPLDWVPFFVIIPLLPFYHFHQNLSLSFATLTWL